MRIRQVTPTVIDAVELPKLIRLEKNLYSAAFFLMKLLPARLILVSDPAIDIHLQRRLEELGARVEIVREPASVGGFQRARLDRMAEFQAAYPDHFWPSQYDNVHNPDG